MPKLYLTNPGTQETVTRPVILEVARQLLEVTGLPADTRILYPGDMMRQAQPGSTMQGQDNVFGNTTFATSERMMITVQEDHDPDRTFSMAVLGTENLPYFLDESVETLLKPVYSPQDVTISFQYRAKDRTGAERWRDDIRARVAMMQDQRLHTFKYSYLVPEEFMVILQEIHRMMEATQGYGRNFNTWFSLFASQRVGEITTQAGTAPKKAVSETQMRVVGYFDFETVAEQGDINDNGSAWNISFNYKFRYDKPVGSVMMYPMMIHNAWIKYIADKPPELPDAHLASYSKTLNAMRYFEQGRNLLGVQNGFPIPPMDEFIPRSVPEYTNRVVTVLTSVGVEDAPANNRILMNWSDLGGDLKLHARILRFLGDTEYAFLTKYLMSVFNVCMFYNRELRGFDKLNVLQNLDVETTEDLSLRNYYHIRLSMLDDFSLLSPAAQERLRANADIVCLILSWFGLDNCMPYIVGIENVIGFDPNNQRARYIKLIQDELAFDHSVLPGTFGSNYISRFDWNQLIANMSQNTIRTGNEFVVQFNTVQTLTIAASKETDLAGR